MSVANESASLAAGKVVLECADGIGTLTLNRPDAGNALDPEMVQDLVAVINRVSDAPEIRVIVIRAAGKAFCVGGDINTFQQHQGRLPEFIDALLKPLNQSIARLAASGRPVVSVVNGAVGGGGIGLALCADFVLAAQSMKLRTGYSAIGLTPDAGSSWFLARRAGATRAAQLFLLNDPLAAEQCLAWGIVDAVHPDAELDEKARALALRLSAGPVRASARAKALVDAASRHDLEAHLQLERQYMVASGGEPDAREGVAAFLAKRPPRFQ